MERRLTLQLGDLTVAKVDAIVNSTRESLLEGGPLHQAVHAAAGPGLRAECEALGGCPVGDVRVTGGHRLPCRFVLHTVVPMWMGGGHGEAQALASCYRRSLELARAREFGSLAFPSLGSGPLPQIPLEVAAPVAVRTILEFLAQNPLPGRVVLVCYDPETYLAHQRVLREAQP